MADKDLKLDALVKEITKLIDEEQYKAAEDLIKRGLKQAKNTKQKSELLICEGVVKFKQARLKEAIKLYRKALKTNPELENDPVFHFNIGSAYFEKCNPIEIWINPDRQYTNKDLVESEKHLKRALNLDNRDSFAADVYIKLAYIYAVGKNYGEAKRLFLKTASISKSKEIIGECYFMLGDILCEEDEYLAAIDYYRKALRYLTQPELIVGSWISIGSNYGLLEKYEKAVHFLNKGLQDIKKIRDPKYRKKLEQQVHFLLGNSYLELKNYDKAKYHLSSALKLAKKNERKIVETSLKYLEAKEKGLIE